jgi:hypothetical protein
MKTQVIITRTDTGANTQVKSDTDDAHKDVTSWSDAVDEAKALQLISSAEAIGAKVLPPGFPFHGFTEAKVEDIVQHGFERGKGAPPR